MTWFLVRGYPVGGLDWGSSPDQGLPGYGRPDNSLPGWNRPVDPGYGQGGINHPGNWVPGSANRPSQGLPGWERPTDPGYGQGGINHPGNWVPGQGLPPLPDAGLPGGPPGHASGQPVPPGQIDNTLPGGGRVHMGEVFIVAYHPTKGLHWVKVSEINKPDQGLPPGQPSSPDNTLPPTAGTKPITPPTPQPKS